jgi:hypothetical protein
MLGYLYNGWDYLFGTHTHHDYKDAFKVRHIEDNIYELVISQNDIRQIKENVSWSLKINAGVDGKYNYHTDESPDHKNMKTYSFEFSFPEKLLGYNNNVIDHIHIEDGYCHEDQTMIGRIDVMDGFEARLALCVDNDALEHTGSHLWMEL